MEPRRRDRGPRGGTNDCAGVMEEDDEGANELPPGAEPDGSHVDEDKAATETDEQATENHMEDDRSKHRSGPRQRRTWKQRSKTGTSAKSNVSAKIWR